MNKPILFSTPMVQAILDGRKTMTRRVVKTTRDGIPTAAGLLVEADNDWCAGRLIKPKYQSGDILWVRETWNEVFRPDGTHAHYIYKASSELEHWRPSIFMPKTAARIFLRVTDVRCERLQKIDIDDAIKEGCVGAPCDCLRLGRGWMGCESCMNTGWQEPPTVEFMQLWEHLNAKRGYGWDANPWVWVYTFESTYKPEGWAI